MSPSLARQSEMEVGTLLAIRAAPQPAAMRLQSGNGLIDNPMPCPAALACKERREKI